MSISSVPDALELFDPADDKGALLESVGNRVILFLIILISTLLGASGLLRLEGDMDTGTGER